MIPSEPITGPVGSVFRNLRNEWKDFLEAIPYFEDITIIDQDDGDIENQSIRALGPTAVKGGKTGVVAILMTVTGKLISKNEFGPVYETKLVAIVGENVSVNRKGGNGTGKTYEEVIEQITAVTNGQFKAVAANQPAIADDPGIQQSQLALGQNETSKTYPAKSSTFSTSISLAILLDKLPTPVITNVAGVQTIQCAQPGAAVFYTVDGTRPGPRDDLYLGPLNLAGVTLKARAWLAGFLASDIATIKIP